MSVTVSAQTQAPSPTSFLTPDRILLMNNMSAVLAGVSLMACLLVLGLVAVIYSDRDSRRALDRLSFRLLVYALMANSGAFPTRGPLSDEENEARLISIQRFQDIPMLDGHGKPMTGGRKLRRSATKLASRSLSTHRRFRNIILRISIYPLVMILLNFLIVVVDIRISTSKGIYTPTDYYLYIIYYTLYGSRGLIYALMAIFDPSIIRGIRVWRGSHHHDDNEDGGASASFTLGGGIISVQGEIIRFVEELGLYPGADERSESSLSETRVKGRGGAKRQL
ncbi:hypothetical protein Q9L58_004539 [Maublancomyces gigas]|uniref:Uncharacterized protein n=1 Tax=Discina gigas TaxID=1032678 RepID=A0ABR3GKP2_9PEZI